MCIVRAIVDIQCSSCGQQVVNTINDRIYSETLGKRIEKRKGEPNEKSIHLYETNGKLG